jgi:pimeloyl-ACP methyl ester carboxylesterase
MYQKHNKRRFERAREPARDFKYPKLHKNPHVGDALVAKSPKISAAPVIVRTRRAYFDFKHGQLHVRTAFPGTGGFDEQVTLFCLHGAHASSRSFAQLLPVIGDVRSVYAPDLPGHGESDPAPHASVSEAASAVADLATDLRLRQIDLLGVQTGAAAALELAAAQPQLVRRLVLLGVPMVDRLPAVKQPALILRTRLESAEVLPKLKEALPNAKFIDVLDFGHDLFESAPAVPLQQVTAFLAARA